MEVQEGYLRSLVLVVWLAVWRRSYRRTSRTQLAHRSNQGSPRKRCRLGVSIVGVKEIWTLVAVGKCEFFLVNWLLSVGNSQHIKGPVGVAIPPKDFDRSEMAPGAERGNSLSCSSEGRVL